MITTVRIRPASPEDADEIASIHVDAWRTTYPGLVPARVLVRLSERAQAREWAAQLGRRHAAESVVVAEIAGRGVVGFGSCGEARTRGLHAGEVYTLYMSPEHQEQGIGRAMLLRLFEHLADRGLPSALVWVLAQSPSRFFYEAMGGRPVGERNQRLWNTVLPQTAYGWDDVRLVGLPRNLSS
ncbi:MAG: GNAT family N-acetyltransferase [Rhodospirillales bacterium]|nr:GNAT family N-acetyltransferase [Rhodospirillales bacterium]